IRMPRSRISRECGFPVTATRSRRGVIWIGAGPIFFSFSAEAVMRRSLFGIAIASILTTGAFAADMPLKAPPIVPPVYTWTGFYAGLNGGYSWGRTSNDYFAPVLAAPGYAYSASRRMDGWVFGGQAGYNWQFNPRWVFGVEGDIDATGQRGTDPQLPYTTVTVFTPFIVGAVPPTFTTTTTTTASLEEKLSWLAT